MFGYVAMWLSEMGKHEELSGILDFADERLKPTWQDGGLFYPRNDQSFDDDLEWTHMDPFTGNGAIAYARLNVEDGQRAIWQQPWTRETLNRRPYLDGVTLADGVDFVRATWDEDNGKIVLTVRSWDGGEKHILPVFRNLAPGTWEVFVSGKRVTSKLCESGGDIAVSIAVSGEDLDVVLVIL
jgi:hypothetical protein